jgi:hypothetical protein
LKKQVLVSVDRGETRVALLEATGKVAAMTAKTAPAARRLGGPQERRPGGEVLGREVLDGESELAQARG